MFEWWDVGRFSMLEFVNGGWFKEIIGWSILFFLACLGYKNVKQAMLSQKKLDILSEKFTTVHHEVVESLRGVYQMVSFEYYKFKKEDNIIVSFSKSDVFDTIKLHNYITRILEGRNFFLANMIPDIFQLFPGYADLHPFGEAITICPEYTNKEMEQRYKANKEVQEFITNGSFGMLINKISAYGIVQFLNDYKGSLK